jgi:hypothetical protein
MTKEVALDVSSVKQFKTALEIWVTPANPSSNKQK